MKNVIKIFEIMNTKNGISSDRIGVNISIVLKIAKRCGLEVEMIRCRKKIYYRLTDNCKDKLNEICYSRSIPKVVLSETETMLKEIRFACLSDLHIGFKEILIEKLYSFLEKAKQNNINYILIAGDLFEGNFMYEGQSNYMDLYTAEQQAEGLFKVLKEFDFQYVAINGNHDYTFEFTGQKNPIYLLKEKMDNYGKKFEYVDSYFANVVLDGVAIRMVHLNDTYGTSKDFACINYANTLPKTIMCEGIEYPLLSVIAGHLHRHEFHHIKEQLIFQPGSIKKIDVEYCRHMGFIVTLRIINGKIEEFSIM